MKVLGPLLSCALVAFGVALSGASLAGSRSEAPSNVGDDYAADGLPKDIPAPGSKPPSVDEWNAVTREVTVKKSSAYHCETKMLREWLRVTCYPYDAWTLKGVKTVSEQGQQAFVGMFGPKASVVVQVVKGKTYVARYTWSDGSSRNLTVAWAGGAPRPAFAFD